MKTNIILLAIFAIIPFHSVFCQWQANPAINNLICNSANDQQGPRAAMDGDKGAIIVWVDYRIDTNGDIYAQRINKNGVNQWNTNGIVISNVAVKQTLPIIIEDGVGGAIIAWHDYRNGNRDIFAQRVDSSGNILWTSNGISVVSKPTEQGGMRMISDGAQGVIIVWQDSINGNYDIFAQRISSTGLAMWTTGGVGLCNDLESQINPKITEDGLGGAIICWQDFSGKIVIGK